ncbi:MAG: cytochrome c peroxidase [Crocinitomicaceae bacterium]
MMHFKLNKLFPVFFLFTCLFISSCKKDSGILSEYKPTPYDLKIPSHFPAMPIPADNPMTKEGVELGRYLFYEKRLSSDNSISCATCHSPANAFSDPNAVSKGVNGTLGNRNAMALINLGWNQFFFWDGRAKTLEQQILQPVQNPVEMHESWPNAVIKLTADAEYQNRFAHAFPLEAGIDSIQASKAIAQFLRTMISAESKFDIIYKKINSLPLTPSEQNIYQTSVTNEELAGYDLFKSLNGADCFHCHNGPLMKIIGFSNNGLDATFTDHGRMDVTANPSDDGKFKIPTLRNIEYSAPYMHDGRFATLDDVIEHYSSGIELSPSIDVLIEFRDQGGVQLDAQEKALLKAFLLTLSDEKFIHNPDFADPN